MEESKNTADATVSLWSYELEIKYAGEAGDTKMYVRTEGSTWGTMCELAEEEFREQPPECMNILMVRIFIGFAV